MPSANGVNHVIPVPPSAIVDVMYRVGLPESPTTIASWTEMGRRAAASLKELFVAPTTTLDDLISAGVMFFPVAYAVDLIVEWGEGKVVVERRDGFRAIGSPSRLWREVLDRYVAFSPRIQSEGVPAQHLTVARERIRMVLDDRRFLLDTFRDIRGREQPTPAEHPVPQHERAHRLVNFVAERSQLDIQPNPLSQIELLPTGTRASRSWGIEVEAVSAWGMSAPIGWESKFDGSLRPADDSDHDPDCDIWNDGEEDDDGYAYEAYCTCGYESEDHCQEFVSEPLTSYHSKGLREITAILGERPVNHTPGIHVHVNAEDPQGRRLTPRQIGSLVYGYELLERLWESEYQRDDEQRRQYSRPYGDHLYNVTWELKRWERSNRWDLEEVPSQYTRYFALNLNSLIDHGTIEFRAMGPVYNYEHLIRWAHFCREMVNVAQAGFQKKDWNKVRSFADLVEVFGRLGRETATPSPARTLTPEQFVVERDLVLDGFGHEY